MSKTHDGAAVCAASAPSSFTRRSFLKGSAAAAITAGACGLVANTTATDSAFADEEAPAPVEEEIYPGTCMGFCTGACFYNLHIRDGKLRHVSVRDMEDPQYNRICQKGYTQPFRVYNSMRLTTPLRRAGERGSGQWEEITWDEAIAEICEKWKAITDEHGPGAMLDFGLTGNMGSVQGSFRAKNTVFARFQALTGMATLEDDVDQAGHFNNRRMMGGSESNTTNGPADFKNAKTILLWGTNAAGSQMHSMHFITEAQQNGAKVIVIDPLFNANASIADQFVPIRPATDGALAFGMLSVVIENGWEDIDFITQHTTAPFLVNPDTHKFMRLSDLGLAEAGSEEDVPVVTDGQGTFDVPENISTPQIEGSFEYEGITYTTAYSLLLERIAEWPVSRAAEVTGLSEETITELTRTYVEGSPSTICTIYGCDHYYNGHWNYSSIATLALLTGNIGKLGASMGIFFTSASSGLNVDWVTDVPQPEGAGKVYRSIHIHEALIDQTYNGEPCDIRGMFIHGANPVANIADRNKTIEGLNNLDLVVVADMVMSETAEYADYVLPACHWFETENLLAIARTHPYMIWQPQALEPLGESKSDFDILKLLAEGMGFGEYFQMTPGDWITELLDSDKMREKGITYEELQKDGHLRANEGKDKPYIFAEGGNFPTPTGRATFYIEDPKPSNDDPNGWDPSKEYLPYWEEAAEVGEHSPARENYPFQLIAEHSRFRTHTQWSEVEALMEVDDKQYIYINPQDAETLGVQDDDLVRVHNDRGYLVGPARLRPNNPPGVLSAVKGWRADQVVEGHLSNLGSTKSNGYCANLAFNDCAVAIEKA